MAGGLDNLSAEGLSKLSKTINEAKELLKQQELLLDRTLEIEQRIIKRRVAGLKEYSDEYSKMLNSIATEQASLSAEMFKINEAGREAAANAEKAAEEAERAAQSTGTTNSQEDNAPKRKSGGARRATKEDDSQRVTEIAKTTVKVSRRTPEKTGTVPQSNSMAINQTQGGGQTASSIPVNTNRPVGVQNVVEPENLVDLTESFDAEQALHEYRLLLDEERRDKDFVARRENDEALFSAASEAQQVQMSARHANEIDLQELIDNSLADRDKAEQESAKSKEERLKKLKKLFLNTEEEDEKGNKVNRKKERDEKYAAATSFELSRYDSLADHIGKLGDLYTESLKHNNGNALVAGLSVAINALSSIAQQLNKEIDEIALYKGKIDTRLHGSKMETDSVLGNSYWDQLVHDMTRVGAVNPYFKQADWSKKIEELVDKGIAFNLDQRSFLAMISDKIATTFEVADATLLRLVRIQQQDSTAGRLGMESALNAFLNEMYENTEYLKTVASSVRTSLEEMQSLMDGAAATEVEYQVQKWMGSLYSVGMSQEAVTKITGALGQIAAGQIEGLTGEGAGNLLIMAANDAGIPIADILAKGLEADETNALLQATVNYLAEIAEASQDNHVIQQQLANVFGVKASDLRAATNLATKDSVGAIYDNVMSYDNMLYYLNDMAGSMASRTSLGEMMTNVWGNLQYSLAGSIASNPISYVIYKAATLLDDTTGGIAIPGISFMGNMVDLETTVADLMRAGALSTGILGSIGALAQGLGNSFSGRAMLDQLGIQSGSGLAVTPRGSGQNLLPDGGVEKTTSESGYVGNASDSDVKNSTMQEAEDSKKQLMIEAQENAEETQIDTINATVLKIYELLDDVAHGNSYFRVKVEGYGLTKAGNSGSSIGGVNALDSLGSSINSQSNSSAGLSSGGVNSGGLGGSVSLSGWTTTI